MRAAGPEIKERRENQKPNNKSYADGTSPGIERVGEGKENKKVLDGNRF